MLDQLKIVVLGKTEVTKYETKNWGVATNFIAWYYYEWF